MKKAEFSLRQVMVLTVTGLLAPTADLLPGLLARTAGRTAWLTPLFMLPAVLLWTGMLGQLLGREGEGLFVLLRRRMGKALGWGLTLLYIMWGVRLLAEQLRRTAGRMGSVYGGRGGEVTALLMLLLAMWMLYQKRGALCRAGEVFWPAAAVTVAAVLLMALPQIRWEYLVPSGEDWSGQPQSWAEYFNVWGTAVFGAALLRGVPEGPRGIGRAMGWMAVSCLGAAALVAAVLGQTGAGLAAELPHPFLVVVQGLSLEGALTRLEAPAAALWLLADFCRVGLLLAALREAGGERWGTLLFLAAGGAAAAGSLLFPGAEGGVSGGILLGILLPFLLWLCSRGKVGAEPDATSCGGERKENHRYCKVEKRIKKQQKT